MTTTCAGLRTLRYDDSAERLLARESTIVVCVPARNEQATIARVACELVGLRDVGAIDRVVVLDDSTDQTPFVAEAAGAEVVRQRELVSHVGELRGKGDAMWRALTIVEEDIVVFVDGDTRDFSGHMAADLAAAVALDEVQFVKAAYRRPFDTGVGVLPSGGGRVTELTAKPLLGHLCSELRAFDQPLAGEIAAPAALLRAVPFATGYSVDVALLIDAWKAVGLGAMAQVHTGARQNRHRPLHELSAMADEVAAAILARTGHPARRELVDRPPHESAAITAIR